MNPYREDANVSDVKIDGTPLAWRAKQCLAWAIVIACVEAVFSGVAFLSSGGGRAGLLGIAGVHALVALVGIVGWAIRTLHESAPSGSPAE